MRTTDSKQLLVLLKEFNEIGRIFVRTVSSEKL